MGNIYILKQRTHIGINQKETKYYLVFSISSGTNIIIESVCRAETVVQPKTEVAEIRVNVLILCPI